MTSATVKTRATINGSVVSRDYGPYGAVAVDYDALTPEIQRRLGLFGLGEKLANATAKQGVNIREKYELCRSMAAALVAGEWGHRTVAKRDPISRVTAADWAELAQSYGHDYYGWSVEQQTAFVLLPAARQAVVPIILQRELRDTATASGNSLDDLLASFAQHDDDEEEIA